MATTKLQMYSELARRQAEQVTRGRGNWTRFLDTAARLYKYPFAEQLMIYAQRPDATACAPIETWNDPMHRWVRRGSKGIALIDDTGSRPYLKYVFDVSDTEPARENARKPYLWEMREEHSGPVMETLGKVYDGVEGDLRTALYNIASQLANEYYNDNAHEIGYSAEGSFLEDFDEFNLGVAFRETLTVSVAYSLMSRCGLDTDAYFEDEDFQPIFDFNTPAAVYALGTAASDLSEQVLRDIEITVKKYERQHAVSQTLAAERSAEHERNERTDIQPGGGLSAARPDSLGAAGGIDGAGRRASSAGQVREDAPELSEGASGHIVQFPAAERGIVPPPAGDRPDSGREDGTLDEGAGGEEPATGQGDRPDGLDGPHERPESPGRGTDTQRTDIQLEENSESEQSPPEQSGGISLPENLEPETYSQVGNMSEQDGGRLPAAPESAIKGEARPPERAIEPLHIALAGSSISVDTVDTVLRDGGNNANSVLRIAAYFMKDKTAAENGDFLKREYATGEMSQPGGKGFQIGLEQTSVWFDETGIMLGRGKSALNAKDSAHISWEQTAVRIRELLDAGRYISSDRMDEALDNEHRELANRLLFLYRDDFRDFRELPEGWRTERGGWPDDMARVKELLEDKKGEYSEYSLILERLEEDVAALSTDPDAPTRFWHDPYRLLQDVRDAGITPITFPVSDLPAPAFMPFITEDEIDAYLTRGSNVSEGKYRIFSFFLHDHTPKERAAFLKKEYGHGGQSHALGGADGSWADSVPGKGIILKRGGLSEPYDTVTLTWSAAEKRINKLIQDGRYMNRAGMDSIPEYERMILAREISSFYYNMPEEYQRPFRSELDFHYPKEAERAALNELLDNPARVDALLDAMRPIMENTIPEDRYYNTRKRAYDDLAAWRDGTFTLFPGVNDLPDPELAAAPRPQPPAQLSLFDMSPQPVLRGVESQQVAIEEAVKEAEAVETSAVSLPITQDEIDALLLGAVETPEQYDSIIALFTTNPRSREAAQLIREIYGDGVYLIDRIDGAEGYMGLLADNAGLTVSKGEPRDIPLKERRPAVSLDLPWAKVHKRVAELVEAGQFNFQHTPEQFPTVTSSVIQDKNTDVSDEKINEALIRGPSYITKFAILNQYGKNEPPEANSIFLKGQYDRLHSTVTLSDGSTLYTRGDERGLAISVQDPMIDDLLLEWPAVERRVAGLIAAGNYLTASEKAIWTRRGISGQETGLEEQARSISIESDAATPQSIDDPPPKWNEYYMFSPEQRATYSREYAAWLERNRPATEHFVVYELPDRAGVYAVWDNEDHKFYEDENGNIETFTDKSDADTYRDRLYNALDGEVEYPAATGPYEPVELDFDTVAQTALERVMQDADYLHDLTEAKSRATLRNPCTWALEQSIRNHEQDEPAVYEKYFSDYDWNERLFNYVLRESWANRPEPERAAEPQQEQPSGVDVTIDVDDDFPDVDVELIRQRLENPTSEDIARVEGMLAAAEEAARQFDREVDAAPEPEVPPQDTQPEPVTPASPPPVFFVDWNTAQFDFDLRRYNDHDVIGYNKDGVEYAVGRSGSLTYITTTTMITPWGEILGDGDIPRNILEQMRAYRDGDLTDEQVKENYQRILSDFAERQEASSAPAPAPAPPEASATPFSEITREDIEAAISRWNGTPESKLLVYQYVQSYPRARETASFLREEYGEYSEGGSDPRGFPVIKEGAEPLTVPWPVVQRHIARLIEAGLFLTPEEQGYADRELDTGWDENESLPEIDTTESAQDEPALPAYIPVNYRITDDNLGAGGPKTRYAANIAAIRSLKQIEAEGRPATRPEQEALARYVGWGGLSSAFDDGNESWKKEYAELKELLTPEEYDKARASVLNAHYTPPVVVRAIYDAIGQMGFKRGNVLEPSCGTGHFFGCIPEEMRDVRLYGVELDDLSARIADLLYPSANIFNNGFEKTNFPDSFFDVVVGNIPFGDYKVFDKDYNRHNFYIHDYFIAKSIDKARAGGVVALITSNGISGGTFDKRDSKARRYMAERCDLIGAIRLPDNTFKAAAGTDMTTDILFLQKREVPRDLSIDMPDWVGVSVVHEHEHEYESGETRNNVLTLNNYYQQHPEMVLGELKVESGPFGPQISCKPKEGDLADQLREAVSHLTAELTVAEPPELDDLSDSVGEAIPADPSVKNFSYTLVDNQVHYRENSLMYPVELPAATLDRIRGMVELRDCVHTLIDFQLNDYTDFDIQNQQKRLNELYDAFTAEYGLVNSVANSRAFSSDSAYFLLCSLEMLDEDGNLERKADMFQKRTIKQKTAVTSVDTASEALAVSIGERARVDMDFMSALSGLSKEKLAEDLQGVIFRLPEPVDEDGNPRYVTADEYLSGNIREKLALARRAAEVADIFLPNVEALEQAMPKDLEASEIAVRLGSTWVDKSYVQQFMYELLQTPYNIQNIAKVNYTNYTGEWQVTGKSSIPYNNVAARVTYGTERRNAYEIIEDTLNLRDVRVYDTITENGQEKRVLNKKQTTLTQQKQEQIKQAFKDWIWKDSHRRQKLVRKYNDLFNSSRPREYDGSHIVFSGMNPEYTIRSYQADAIARVLYGGNTLLAHEVGAGKTFEMVAAAMEGKRLGLCNKSMFAVPNHIIDQIASDFLRLYPSANLLVATKKDFEMRNRKKFCAKIATGDYDAVIIGHSQLEKIPISIERQERLLQEQLWEVLEGIDELKRSRGERFSVKQLERTRKRLETRLEKLREGKKRDDVVTFEQLGVDRLFVDEAHNYKNCAKRCATSCT